MVAQGTGWYRLRLPRDIIGNEVFFAGYILTCEDSGLFDVGVSSKGKLDFVGFDAEAADFDLIVETAEKVEIAIGEPAHRVARAVESVMRIRAKGMGNKLLLGEVWPV
ncbi:MAG: hypothetical protein ABSH28_09420 [Acidobacteriota bacterium]